MSHCQISFQRIIYLVSFSSPALLSAARPGCERKKSSACAFESELSALPFRLHKHKEDA